MAAFVLSAGLSRPAMAARRHASAERRQVYYSGHVQGVGFRYTVYQFAAKYAVTGFVKNLPDGRVELVAEGTPSELNRFMKIIAARMAEHIRNVAVDVRPALGEFNEFEIQY